MKEKKLIEIITEKATNILENLNKDKDEQKRVTRLKKRLK